MALNDQLADMEYKLNQLIMGLSEVQRNIEGISEQLKYDIEPKLDKALEGKTAPPKKEKLSIEHMLWLVRQIAVEVREGRKIEAIKCLRKLTNCGLAEGKITIEFLEKYSDYSKKEAF